MEMQIVADNTARGWRTGTLSGVTVAEVSAALGFAPNVDDDPAKVENSWGFKVGDQECGIWDYHGSHLFRQFSTYGPRDVFDHLFPGKYTEGW